MRPGFRRTVALACVCLMAGCYTTHSIPLDQLHYLDGYDVHREESVPVSVCGRRACSVVLTPISEHTLIAKDGALVRFASDTPLVLEMRGGQSVGGTIAALRVSPDLVSGAMVDGQTFSVPTDRIASAEVTVEDPAKAQAVVGVAAFAAAGIALLVGVLVARESCRSHCGSFPSSLPCNCP